MDRYIVRLIKINFTKCKVYQDVKVDYFDILTILYSLEIDLTSNVYTILTVLSPTVIQLCSQYSYLRCILSLCSAPYLVRYAIGNSVLSNDIYFTRLVGKCFPFPRITDSVLFNLYCVYIKPERMFWTDMFVYI